MVYISSDKVTNLFITFVGVCLHSFGCEGGYTLDPFNRRPNISRHTLTSDCSETKKNPTQTKHYDNFVEYTCSDDVLFH